MKRRSRAFAPSAVLGLTAAVLAAYIAWELPRRACQEYIEGKTLLLEECVAFTPQFDPSPFVFSIVAVTLVLLLAVNVFAGESL